MALAMAAAGCGDGEDGADSAVTTTATTAGADLVLAGHEHNYERFGPLDPAGRIDEQRGIRSFVVGTGGRSHYAFGSPLAGSEARNHDTFGVLRLTLAEGHFDWAFVPVAGKTFTDSGSAPCH